MKEIKMIKQITTLFIFSLLLVGCTDNQAARNWGGTMKMDLPDNEKLINVTWKNEEIWYLTKPMTKDDVAESYKFHEYSSWGVLEGTVVLTERKVEEVK
jgi:uncharacterized protein YcfL